MKSRVRSGRLSRLRVPAAALLSFAWLAAAACSSSKAGSTKIVEGCKRNSDCSSALICALGTCTSKCATSADCPDDGSCVTDGSHAICQSAADKNTPCDKQADCPAPLACASDYRCRNLCNGDVDCNVLGIAGRLCVEDAQGVKYCAESGELNPDGGLPDPPKGAPDSGVTEPQGAGAGGASGGSAGGMNPFGDAGSSGAMNSDAGGGEAGASSAGVGGYSAGGSGGQGVGGSGAGGVAGAAFGGAGFGGAGASTVVPLPSDPSGAVSVPALGIHGFWYAYSDGIGADGSAATGICEAIGMHAASECSKVTSPAWGPFPNTNSRMCTSGTVAKVLTGTIGCTAPATSCPDYSDMYGAAIGLGLNNVANVEMPYNASNAGIVGVSFDVDAVPLAGIRVEFVTAATESAPAIWKPGTTNLSPLAVGHNVLLFADVVSPTWVSPAVAFDPKRLTSVHFLVPTKTTAPADYNFCISNFAVITM